MRDEPFLAAFLRFANAVPFTPFVVELVHRDRLVIHHPEAVLVESGQATYIEPDGTGHYFDPSSVAQVMILGSGHDSIPDESDAF